ncbi:MAG: hypothetical protein R2939_22320 [Kofleriaceae bacterium]
MAHVAWPDDEVATHIPLAKLRADAPGAVCDWHRPGEVDASTVGDAERDRAARFAADPGAVRRWARASTPESRA